MVSSNTEEAKDSSTSSGSSGDLPVSDSGLFSPGERVLAYHGPRIYQAKVQKAELREKEWRYFVHYLGWNKNWDEWVGTDRLLKHTEENVVKQQALDKRHRAEKNAKSGRSTQPKPKSSTDAKVDKDDLKTYATKRKKQKTDAGIEKDNLTDEKTLKIQIPSNLRKQLVGDWDFVTQQDKLVKLPRSPTVDDIFTQYLEYISNKDAIMTGSVEEILKGLRSYFDKMLPVMLLYKKERQQYREEVTDNASPSSIYGAEHLLRLFVKLPELLAYVNMEEETLVRLQQNIMGFLMFLQKNQSTFFFSTSSTDSEGSDGSENRKDD